MGMCLDYDTVEVDQVFEFTVEDGLLGQLKLIEPLVVEVVSSSDELFTTAQRVNGNITLKSSSTGTKLLSVLSKGQSEFTYYFPVHELNPYVDLLFTCAGRVTNPLLFSHATRTHPSEVLSTVEALSALVADIRRAAQDRDFKRLVRNFSKASTKRTKSLESYIDALFKQRSRLVVIRLDLSYQSGLLRQKESLQESLDGVKNDWGRMQRDLHKGVPVSGLLGFACKLEYGHRKGFHFHLLAFYDGATYRKDVVLAKLLGEHWQEAVTKGKGRYFNCNNQQWKYLYRGVGVVGHRETDVIRNLKGRVASYLTKVDYWVRLSPSSGRSFFRGNMPKLSAVKKGRPRGYKSEQTLPSSAA